MDGERVEIIKLFRELPRQPPVPFPQPRQKLVAPDAHGVCTIRDSPQHVVHVGRTVRGKNGLRQRLGNHLAGPSSFMQRHLAADGSALRDGYTFQYIEVARPRERALVEALASGWLCPDHLGLGERVEADA
jgi:hypothetical protein